MKNVLFILSILFSGILLGQTKMTFNYTGSFESWTVPTGVTSIDVKIWGAGGGAGNSGTIGGSGSFVSKLLM